MVCCTLPSGPHDIRPTLWQEGPNESLCLPSCTSPSSSTQCPGMVLSMTCDVTMPCPAWSPLTALQGPGNSSNSLTWLLPGSLCPSYHLSEPHSALSFLNTLLPLPGPSLFLPAWPSSPLSHPFAHLMDMCSSPKTQLRCHLLYKVFLHLSGQLVLPCFLPPIFHVHNSVPPTLKKTP